MTINMRIPTNKEWEKMMDDCHENNDLTHWHDIFSWVNDEEECCDLKEHCHACRGFASARLYNWNLSSSQLSFNGFRPAFDNLTTDISEDGAVRVIGTLYMDGIPVPAPSKPIYDGDIQDYIPDAKLEMREPLDDPQYQVRAIKVGSTYIADRVLLKNISYEDIVAAITTKED